MLHAVLKMFWGPLENSENAQLADVSKRELATLLPLVALVFLLGFFPHLVLDKMNPSVDGFLKEYEAKLLDSNQNDSVHLYKAELPAKGASKLALRGSTGGDR
jgi:NADH-quinone oxidoreductase subunit M